MSPSSSTNGAPASSKGDHDGIDQSLTLESVDAVFYVLGEKSKDLSIKSNCGQCKGALNILSVTSFSTQGAALAVLRRLDDLAAQVTDLPLWHQYSGVVLRRIKETRQVIELKHVPADSPAFRGPDAERFRPTFIRPRAAVEATPT